MTMPEKTAKKGMCFVISPIGDEGSEIRGRSDRILNHVIAPIVDSCGYETIRADKISKSGIITMQVIQHLSEDPLVIADLTDYNPNVFYELAIRHAVKKPCIHMIQADQEIPFDVSPNRTIKIDHRDLESAARCKEELLSQIHAAEKDPNDVDNPISTALEIKALRSGNLQEKSNAEILTMLYEIRRLLPEPKPFRIAPDLLLLLTSNLAEIISLLEANISTPDEDFNNPETRQKFFARMAQVFGLTMRHSQFLGQVARNQEVTQSSTPILGRPFRLKREPNRE